MMLRVMSIIVIIIATYYVVMFPYVKVTDKIFGKSIFGPKGHEDPNIEINFMTMITIILI